MKDHDVNFNNKTILLDGEWFNIKELGEKIKYNINKGNYKIKHLSVALEDLQEVLESAKEIKVSVLGNTYDELEKISKKYNKNIEIIVRDAIERYIDANNNNDDEKEPSKPKEDSIDIDMAEESKPIVKVKPKPEVIKVEKLEKTEKPSKDKPSIIENKIINSDKEIKKQPSIIVNKTDDDDWFNK